MYKSNPHYFLTSFAPLYFYSIWLTYSYFIAILVSETDGEEDDDSQPTKKEKSGSESSSSHLAAMKKLSGLIAGHLGGMQDSKNRYLYVAK